MLVCDYLIPKVKNQQLPCTKVFIEDRDLYSNTPWSIIKKGDPFEYDCLGDNIVKTFYVFTRVKKVSGEGTRFSRTVGAHGTWKGETGKKKVHSYRYVDGKKEEIHAGYWRLLKFKANEDGGGLRRMYGDWNMHEISLAGDALSRLEGSYPLANELVVCQVKQTILKNLVCWDNEPLQSNLCCDVAEVRDMFTPTFPRTVRPRSTGQYVGPTEHRATHLTNGETMWPNSDCSSQQLSNSSNWCCAEAEGRYTSTPSFSRTLEPSSIGQYVGPAEHLARANGETMWPNLYCSLQQPTNCCCSAAEDQFTSTPSFSRTLQPSSIRQKMGLTEHSATHLTIGEMWNQDCSSHRGNELLAASVPFMHGGSLTSDRDLPKETTKLEDL